jgi:hypothetical protein
MLYPVPARRRQGTAVLKLLKLLKFKSKIAPTRRKARCRLRLCADSLRVAGSVQAMPPFFSGRNQVSMRCLSGIVVRRRATCLRDSDASDHLTGSRRAKATSLVGSAARSTTQTSPSALPWVTSHLAPRQSGRRDSSWTPSATASRMRSKARSLRRCLPVRIRQ